MQGERQDVDEMCIRDRGKSVDHWIQAQGFLGGIFQCSKRDIFCHILEPVSYTHLDVYKRQVQGVGFRYRAQYAAQLLDLTGWVENNWDGTVDLEAQGSAAQLDRLVRCV